MTCFNRDYQKSKVYAWEDAVVGPRDKSQIRFEDAQTIVNYIWASEGLFYPPKVIEMNPRNKNGGSANRHNIWLHKDRTTPTWIILHEACHSMTCTATDDTDNHGAIYMGVYVRLLAKLIGVPMPLMLYTLNKDGVKFNITAHIPLLDK